MLGSSFQHVPQMLSVIEICEIWRPSENFELTTIVLKSFLRNFYDANIIQPKEVTPIMD